MPRNIRPSGSSQAHLKNQFNIAQGSNAPTTRPQPEQSSASQSSGQPHLDRQGKDRFKAQQLRKQFELEKAEDKANARKWGRKFEKYFVPIDALESKLGEAVVNAWEDLHYFEGKDRIIAKAPPEKKELVETVAIKRFERSIERFDKAISDNYKKIERCGKAYRPSS